MLRLIFAHADAGNTANVGGPVKVEFKTFDVELPQVEKWYAEKIDWCQRTFEGIEVLPDKEVA